MDKIWEEMILLAKAKKFEWNINDFVEVGGVVACLRTKSGTNYVGLCFDTSAGLGMCAERAAIVQMLTAHENEIDRMVCIGENNSFLTPCGVCREAMKQLSPKHNGKMQILLNCKPHTVITLDELLPHWWGDGYERKIETV